MKQLFIFTFLVVMVGHISAQKLIQKEALNSSLLKTIFESAAYEVTKVEDTYIKVHDTWNFYLDIDKDKRFVTFSNYFKIADSVDKKEVYALIDMLSEEVVMLKMFYNEDKNSMNLSYYFWTEGGFTKESILGAIKLHKKAIRLILNLDKEKLIK